MLETGVFAKPCIEIANGKVKRVRSFDQLGEFLGRSTRDIHLLGVTDSLSVCLRDGLHIRFAGELGKEPFAQNVIDLVRIQPHRLQHHGTAANFIGEIFQGAVDPATALFIRGFEV